jgi:hypothetical protein
MIIYKNPNKQTSELKFVSDMIMELNISKEDKVLIQRAIVEYGGAMYKLGYAKAEGKIMV